MPRRGRVTKRKVEPDSVYGSELIQRFINKLMWDGKKSKSESIVYKALELSSKKLEKEPLDVFKQAIKIYPH